MHFWMSILTAEWDISDMSNSMCGIIGHLHVVEACEGCVVT